MAKTQLNLILSYKGKTLDVIKQGKDFTNKWIIGSNKRLLWQILDTSFPFQHRLLIQKGDNSYLQMPPGASLTCSKDGKPVEAAYLQQNGILQGGSLLLRNDMAGTIKIAPDWDISYEYAEPRVLRLTDQEQRLVAQYSRREALTPSERANRTLILVCLIVGIIFLLVYDYVLKPKAEAAATLAAKLAELERAQRIEAMIGEPEELPEQEMEATGVTEMEGVPSEERTTTGTGRRAPATAQATFGRFRSSDPTSGAYTSGQPAQQATVLREFVTARPGSRIGTGGSGGVGPSFDATGGGAGSGYSPSFNPGETARYNQTDLSQVVIGQTPRGGTTVRPTGKIDKFTGDASKLAPARKPLPQSAQTQRIIQSFQSPSISTISENNVVGSTAGASSDVDDIYGQLYGRKGQITQLYRKHSAVQASSGSISIKMYIDSNGTVVADVTPNSASFTQSFLQEVKRLVENWTFRVSKKTIYQFQIRLSQR
jgi:hypothetical protein